MALRSALARVLDAAAVAAAQSAAQQAIPRLGRMIALPREVADLKARVEALETPPARRRRAEKTGP